MKYAIFSMDIEDWYHLDYFRGKGCDLSYSMLDGLLRYQEIINQHRILSTFFVLGELVAPLAGILKGLDAQGHEIVSHGWGHVRPITIDIREFETEVTRCKKELEQVLGKQILGYRAPCFSMDRARLDVLQKTGFKYDSSRIMFSQHPLYRDLNVDGYQQLSSNIFRFEDFIEFQVSTLKCGQKHIPVSGGGYLRIFPWIIMKKMLKNYLSNQELYVLYIHPFELSSKSNPIFPSDTKLSTRTRFSLGRSSVTDKLNSLINMLKKESFQFTTFSLLREKLIHETG